MADKRMPFTGPMIRALFAGHKTQTRRVLRYQGDASCTPHLRPDGLWAYLHPYELDKYAPFKAPYALGDRCWVTEQYSGPQSMTGTPPRDWPEDVPIWYWADGHPDHGDWTRPKPGMFMTRRSSRATVIVTDVRLERLHDISAADALAEGIICERVIVGSDGSTGVHREQHEDRYFWHHADDAGSVYAESAYADLWDVINKRRGIPWDANPWVCAATFEFHPCNIDQLRGAHG